jgi:GAF domain-containing protein/HAMP domain-containing protein
MKNSFTQSLDPTSERGENALRLTNVFMVAAGLAVLIFAYVAVISGAWQGYAVTVGFVGFFAIGAVAARFARQNQIDRAGTLLIVNVSYIVLVMISFMGNIGFALSIALGIVIVEIAFDTLSGPLARRASVIGFAVATAMFLIDRFAPWSRPLIPVVQYAIPLIAAGTVIAIAVLMFRRLVTWRDLKLASKLLIAFSAVALLTLVLGIFAFLNSNNVANTYESALANGEQMQVESLLVQDELKIIRELEQQFLLNWQEQGFVEAREAYIVPLLKNIVTLREELTQLDRFASVVGSELGPEAQTQFEADLKLMQDDLRLYEQSLYTLLQSVQLRGFEDTGFEGQLRVAVQTLETRVYDREGLDELVITTLQIRRREKDYLLRGRQEYIDNVHQLVAELKQQISTSEALEVTEKEELSLLADQYLVAFDALVQKDVELATAVAELEQVEQAMVPLVTELVTIGAQLSDFDVEQAQTTNARSNIILIISVLAAFALAVYLGSTLARSISQPVVLLTRAAEELQAGNYDSQTEVTTKDELGILGTAFNIMAVRLKAAFALVNKRAVELQSVAEIATQASQSTDIQSMLQTVVDMTKSSYSLYHTHIYLVNNDKTKLELAAGAGEPGRQMVSEKRTIAMDHPRSLVARAARTGQGAISNDVSKEPDFLPNPLLPNTKAEMAIPILLGDRVLGILDVQADYVDRFTDEDIAIQTTLAQQVAASLESLRQYQISQKVARELAVVANVSTATSTITETLPMLQEVVDRTKEAFSLYHAHIYLMNAAEDTLVLAAGAGEVGRKMVAEGRQIALDSEKSLVARAARTRAGTVVNDVSADPDFLPNPLLPETKSEQAVPMIVGDKVVGVLDVQSEQLNRFTEIDVNIKTTLAAQVAVALQNARTFEQAQGQAQREATLNTIGQKIQTATTVEAVLQIAARELGRALSAPLTIAQLSLASKDKAPSNTNGNGSNH